MSTFVKYNDGMTLHDLLFHAAYRDHSLEPEKCGMCGELKRQAEMRTQIPETTDATKEPS